MSAERKNYGEFYFFAQLRQKLPNKNKTGRHCYKYWTGRSDVIVTNTGHGDQLSLLQILDREIKCHCYKCKYKDVIVQTS